MLVSGMPRGGTTFIANLLNQIIPTGHESIFGNGHINDPPLGCSPSVEVSGFSAPWTPLLRDRGVKIVQLVRNPLKCCTSCYNYFKAGQQHLTWEEVCNTYLTFHGILEGTRDVVIHLERWAESMPEILALLREKDPEVSRGWKPKPGIHSPSSWAEPRRKWSDMPKELQEYGRKHGYFE